MGKRVIIQGDDILLLVAPACRTPAAAIVNETASQKTLSEQVIEFVYCFFFFSPPRTRLAFQSPGRCSGWKATFPAVQWLLPAPQAHGACQLHGSRFCSGAALQLPGGGGGRRGRRQGLAAMPGQGEPLQLLSFSLPHSSAPRSRFLAASISPLRERGENRGWGGVGWGGVGNACRLRERHFNRTEN